MGQLLEYASHHPWLISLAVAAGAAVLVYELRARAANAAAIGPQDAVRLMNQGATVLDVRSAEAFATGHIRGARHLPPDQLGSAGVAMKRLKERPVVVYCERGSSAAGAVRQLAQQGFSKVFNLRGGVAAWRAENLPLARD
jgi:rhodanese-related sulfurtransferase